MFNSYQLQYKKPRNSLETCLLKNKTFSVQIICPIKVSYKGCPIINCVFFKSEVKFDFVLLTFFYKI